MSSGPGDYSPVPPRFDRKNVAVGAVVSSLLVGLLGYGTILFFQAITPGEEGVNIGGVMLATFGCLLAVALGAAFTARRARRRQGQPVPEGVGAGLAGFTLATCIFVIWFLFNRGVALQALFVIPEMLPLLVPCAAAAFAGAALGSLHRNNGQTR
jgi:ABC-type polysaccharide/polyol phosphate export permease